jgi:hypothetical protein
MAKVFLLIVVGLAGDPEHGELFRKWGLSLAEAAEGLGVTPDRLVYLVDDPDEENQRVTGGATRAEVEQAFQSFAAAAGPDDQVFVMLIGHGDFRERAARFNLRGRDMAAEDFQPLLDALPAKQIVFVNTTASSGPFVEALSGPGRTIVTATRNGAEQYTTLFGGVFVEALTSEAADADKNRRVSVLEAFNFAKAEVERAYKREGLLQTEHALLDDNGDKEGTQAISASTGDGRMASVLSLGSFGGGAAPSDPKLAALYAERRDMERRIETLTLLKGSMAPALYQTELETLAIDLARKTREIRDAEQVTQP